MLSSIDQWLLADAERARSTTELKQLYELQEKFLFRQYRPIRTTPMEAAAPFMRRVDKWLAGFKDPKDRWNAFHALRYFLFIGEDETEEMYRCAVNHFVLPWLADVAKLDIFAPGHDSQLNAEVLKCWPCPVSDSLRINELLHATGLTGQGVRSDWHGLRQLASTERIQTYVNEHNIKYLILFEDFVGTGKQFDEAATFAISAFAGPILIVPLVVCFPGHERLLALQAKHPKSITYRPVVVIGEDCLIRKDPCAAEPASFADLRKTLIQGYKDGGLQSAGGAFGYGGVGSLASSFGNCPNNTPPIFHQRTKLWPFPIFPRRSRRG